MEESFNIAEKQLPIGNIPFVELYFSDKDATGGQAIALPLMDYPITSSAADVEGSATPPEALAAPVNRLYLVSMTHTIKNVATSAGHHLTLQILDPGWDFLTSMTANKFSHQKGFSLRYGWRGVDDVRVYSPTRIPFFLDDVTTTLIPFKGALVTIHGVDQSFSLSSRQVNHAFPSTMPISTAIEVILKEEGFIPVVPDIRTPVGDLNLSTWLTPEAYIDHLLCVAYGTDGKTYFTKTVRLSSIMGQPEYVIAPVDAKNYRLRKKYVFGRDRMGSMLSFSPILNHKLLQQAGGGKTTAIVLDPQTKRWNKTTSTQAEDTPEGDKRSDETPQDPTIVIESPFPLFQTQALVSKLRQEADSLQWEADASVIGDTEILPTDYVAILVLKGGAPYEGVQYLSPNDIYWFASGLWRVVEVTHTISEPTGFQTSMRLARFGGFVGKGESSYSAMPFTFSQQPQTVESPNLVEVEPVVNPGEGESKTAISGLQSVLNFITSFT